MVLLLFGVWEWFLCFGTGGGGWGWFVGGGCAIGSPSVWERGGWVWYGEVVSNGECFRGRLAGVCARLSWVGECSCEVVWMVDGSGFWLGFLVRRVVVLCGVSGLGFWWFLW